MICSAKTGMAILLVPDHFTSSFRFTQPRLPPGFHGYVDGQPGTHCHSLIAATTDCASTTLSELQRGCHFVHGSRGSGVS